MKLLALSLALSAKAICQSAPPNALNEDALKKLLEVQKLPALPALSPTMPKVIIVGKPVTVCAIPLLNALPANGNIDYKIQIVGPRQAERVSKDAPVQIGIPACK
jgi:hypothetical protein